MSERDERTVKGGQGLTLDVLLCSRPSTLTSAHAEACLPSLEIDREWRVAEVSGRAPKRLAEGCLCTVWPDERFIPEEAGWFLGMREHCSLRTLASFVFGDDNQITGMQLEEAAHRALADEAPG